MQWIMDPLCRLRRRKTSHKRVSLIQSSAASFKCHRFSLFRLLFQPSLLIGRFYCLFTAILTCAFPVLPCVLHVLWPCAGFIHVRNSRQPIKSENWDVIRAVLRISLLLRPEVTSQYPFPEYPIELPDPVWFRQQRDASLSCSWNVLMFLCSVLFRCLV
jgi:hypothetical protein